MYEIRDYHYRPDIIDRYKKWAEDAVIVPVSYTHLTLPTICSV